MLQLVGGDIVIPSGNTTYSGTALIDSTVGVNTKLVFKYNTDIDISVTTNKGQKVTISKSSQLKRIVATIEGEVVSPYCWHIFLLKINI